MKLTTKALWAFLSGATKGTLVDDDVMTTSTYCLCDGYVGGAKALCNMYCGELDCYSTEGIRDVVCEKYYNDFVAETGEQPPCAKPCPCFDASNFAGLDLYCQSFEPGTLLVTDNPAFPESNAVNIIATADAVGLSSCQLTTDIGSGTPVTVFASIPTNQAKTCLDILYGTGCRLLNAY